MDDKTTKTRLNDHIHDYDPANQRCGSCGLTRLELEGWPEGTWFQTRLTQERWDSYLSSPSGRRGKVV